MIKYKDRKQLTVHPTNEYLELCKL